MAKNKFQIEYWPVDKIHPYDKNAKIHTEAQVRSLADVIKSQGWDVPIVVDKHGVIIKGHGRRLAALHLGLKEVPVLVRSDLSDAEVKAARLSDNRVAMGDFDVDAIKEELSALRDDGFDLSNSGFGDKELEMLLGNLDEVDFAVFEPTEDDTPSTHQSAPEAIQDNEATPEQPKAKTLLVTDLLGFKQVPAKYKDGIIEFMASIQKEILERDGKEVDAATAFGEFCSRLNFGEV